MKALGFRLIGVVLISLALRLVSSAEQADQAHAGRAVRGDISERNRIMPIKPPVIHSDPEILSGTPVFVGTRVPVQSLSDYLDGGDTLDEFLRQFPSVRREQAVAALEFLPGRSTR
jgi:uncharacterized protein (DUF433 family)